MRLKNFVFRWHIIIAVAALIGLVILAGMRPDLLPLQAYLTIAAGAFYFVSYVQKQSLEETRLFRDLFKDFNSTYDKMNGELFRILKKATLNNSDKELLIDYFNLCAEEYLMFKRGYILPEVWNAWQKGMNLYYADPKIRLLWDAELTTNSYYGFQVKNQSPL